MLIKNNDLIYNSVYKIKYSARRGMLELDIILAPYLNNFYMHEDLANKKLFVEYLTSEYSDMFDWLFKGVTPPHR
ncbi:succinate dehydrogenase assembly factor 2, partial [Francisella tularensis subsp. holarctica]|uniref:FAD assembly factor SdhE n=1 Tax=Francisella tularensis TaxID=263 RepID=UPI002381B6E2